MPQLAGDDRLLTLARWTLTFLMAFTALGGAIALIGIPLVFLARDRFVERLSESGIGPEAVSWLGLMMALIAGIAVLGFLFFRHLRRIVDSVVEGDPFVPVNADRLQAMAWLSLGIQAILFVLAPLFYWFDALPLEANVHHNSEGVSVMALIMALMLFVLARVFRTGTQMRADLEGTV